MALLFAEEPDPVQAQGAAQSQLYLRALWVLTHEIALRLGKGLSVDLSKLEDLHRSGHQAQSVGPIVIMMWPY